MNERKSLPSTSAAEADPPSKQDVAPSRGLLPRLLRFRDAPRYLGMDRNRLNAEVRPYVTVIRIGRQGVAFDRLELDAWVDQYKSRNGRPGQLKGDMTWDEKGVPGLYKRSGVWHIDKVVLGRRLCESTGTSNIEEAERVLARLSETVRQQVIYGARPDRLFREAAIKYLNETYKRSLARDAQDLAILDPFIGDLLLRHVHMGTLARFITARRAQGVRSATVNRSLAVVRRILNLAARLWRDEGGMTWLESAPLLQFVDWGDRYDPYPLSWDEQTTLFKQLPPHLGRMALFKVNTGCREQEVCKLRWDWEIAVPELSISVFIIPREWVKNGEDRLVVLNDVARSVVEGERGKHPTHVFTYRGHPVTKMYNGAWKRARVKVGPPMVRIHDLKHTYGRRLRAAGVRLPTRKVLLGHKSGDITTHYSAPELEELLQASNRVCGGESRKSPALVVLRKRVTNAAREKAFRFNE